MKLFLIVSLLAFSNWCSAQVSELTLASDVWPPFTNVDPQRAFALDLVQEALNRSGVKSETKIVEFEEVVKGIVDGSYHGSAALWYTKDREETLLFSAPYLQNRLILVGRKGVDVGMTSFSELNGKKVAVVGSYAYGAEVEQAEGVDLIQGKSDQQNLELLLKHEVDYMLVDALLMEYMLTHQKDEVLRYLQVGRTPLITRSLHLAIRKDIQNAKSIMERFNQGIIKMIADGTYNRILQINWIRADVDGDGKLELVGGNNSGKAAPTSSYDVWFETNSAPSNTNRYYVDGRVYQGWDNVPQQYKSQPVSERPEDLKLLKFGL